MRDIGTIVELIIARAISARKEPAGVSRRPSSNRGETSAADPRAASGSPDRPAMGERGNMSFGGDAAGGDRW